MAPEDRKAQILRTAARVFAQKGYVNTGIGDICKELRISRGTLYQYFKNKQHLFHQVIHRYLDTIEVNMTPADPALIPEALGPDELVMFLTERMVGIYTTIASDKDLMKILYMETGTLSREVDDLLDRVDDHFINLIKTDLSILAERGRMAREDLDVAARIILGGVIKVSIDLIVKDSEEEIRRIARSTARVLAQGIWGGGVHMASGSK